MRKQLLAFTILVWAVCPMLADEKTSHATIVGEKSVDCGTSVKGKNKSTEILCQQYTVRTPTTEYQIRQQKPGDAGILAPNTPIDFTVDKDKMKFKVNGKKYEFLIVGTSAVGAPGT